MTRVTVWMGLLLVTFGVACAGAGAPSTARRADAEEDICSSVAEGVRPAAVERMGQASNVLEYERIWQAEHPGTAPGTISGTEVRARIRANTAGIQECYESALDRLPAGKGRVVVRFVVAASGSVPAVNIASNDFDAPAVGCCVAKRVAEWKFPSPTNGDFIVVEYPFVVRTMK